MGIGKPLHGPTHDSFGNCQTPIDATETRMTPGANILSRLTKEQQDLLRLIVEKYPVNNPTQFIVSRNFQTSALGYGPATFRISADEPDFRKLEREQLITLAWTP